MPRPNAGEGAFPDSGLAEVSLNLEGAFSLPRYHANRFEEDSW
jgi:hypothetical protein